MPQDHKMLRLNQAENCSACSPVVGLRLVDSNLPGLVGQVVGRAAVPLPLTKASEKRDWRCRDVSPTVISLLQYSTALPLLAIGKFHGETPDMDLILRTPFAVKGILCAKWKLAPLYGSRCCPIDLKALMQEIQTLSAYSFWSVF